MSSFQFQNQTVRYQDGETVLDAVVRQGLDLPHACKIGACQSCLVKCTEGEPSKKSTGDLSENLQKSGCFLACQAAADSVKTIELPSPDILPKVNGTITLSEMISGDVLKLILKLESQFDWQPGKFVRLTLGETTRCYSIANLAWSNQSSLEFHIRLIEGGAMSTEISNAEIGDSILIEGPMGNCYYRPEHKSQPLLLIGSGTGLAPMIGVISDALNQGHEAQIHLYHGAAVSDSLYFRDEMKRLAVKYENFTYTSCADTSTNFEDREGSPLDLALEDHNDLKGWRIYTCGHPELVNACKKRTYIAGASLKEIHADPYEDQSLTSAA